MVPFPLFLLCLFWLGYQQLARIPSVSPHFLANAWMPHHAGASINHPYRLLQHTRPTAPASFKLNMKNIFRQSSDASAKSTSSLPKDVKDAVRRCKDATQKGLQAQISRMDVEFPVGTKFGVEKTTKQQRGGRLQDPGTGSPTQQDFDRSDRELARLFVDMFQPVGGENISVIFPDQSRAEMAKQQWDTSFTQCRILSMDNKKVKKIKKKASSQRGFAAKLKEELDEDSESAGPFQLPPNTEVALFVAPITPKARAIVDRISNEVGMGTLVILLNARLGKYVDSYSATFQKDFEPIFHLAAADQSAAPNCLLYRAFPNNWSLARKPKVGTPKTIHQCDEKPTVEQCRTSFDQLELSGVEKNVESLMENFADWLW